MCGVVSIVYDEHNDELGKVGAFLLKKLEYRGYDSTGGAFMKADGSCILKKKVGAPSIVTEELEMGNMSGQKFIGQVRWATYGAVTDHNAQPHQVACHIALVGAHNGNISNTDSLKDFLCEQGHRVVSDNDGEMLVHLVEHFYAKEYANSDDAPSNEEARVAAMIRAIRKAESIAEGSYAACVTAPDIQGVFAIKSGSSLYAGKGSDENGSFIVVSSDLTSVLAKTRFLIPLSEGECIYFTSGMYRLYALQSDASWVPKPVRSRLNIADISLAPKFHYFMEQEIFTSAKNIQPLFRYYFPDEQEQVFFDTFEAHTDSCRELLYAVLRLNGLLDPDSLQAAFSEICGSAAFSSVWEQLNVSLPGWSETLHSVALASEEASLFQELHRLDESSFAALFILDRMLIWKKKRRILQHKDALVEALRAARESGGRVFAVASGTSHHATLSGAYFFNHLANIALFPANPGGFRAMYLHTLRPGDVVIGVSQSGETKDLVDIFTDLRTMYGDTIQRIGIVNNENSTLPQEKVDFYLPILCGPEIAVAATKSFTSQLALLFVLAASVDAPADRVRKTLQKIVSSMEFTLRSVDPEITEVALRLYQAPSMHILGTSLAGLSREGALKIREVVLNHTEGYDAAEFKHGPNTILGKNTIYSLSALEHLQADMLKVCAELIERLNTASTQKEDEDLVSLLQLLKSFKLRKMDEDALVDLQIPQIERELGASTHSSTLTSSFLESYQKCVDIEKYFSNYPLLFLCAPDARDKRITISQIHTHKIRGADIILIAEEDAELEKAASGCPAGFEQYYHKCVRLPSSGDKIVFHFNAAIVLQLLALRMSIAKMKYLNNLKVENHGVHPDVPKNVSKSITVD